MLFFLCGIFIFDLRLLCIIVKNISKNITRKFGYLQIVVLSLHPLSGPGDVSGCYLKEFL